MQKCVFLLSIQMNNYILTQNLVKKYVTVVCFTKQLD